MEAPQPKSSTAEAQRRRNPDRLFAAYSIYHHSNPDLDPIRPTLPQFMRPVPLLDAVHRLVDDSDHEAQHIAEVRHRGIGPGRSGPSSQRRIRPRPRPSAGRAGASIRGTPQTPRKPAAAVHLAMDDGKCESSITRPVFTSIRSPLSRGCRSRWRPRGPSTRTWPPRRIPEPGPPRRTIFSRTFFAWNPAARPTACFPMPVLSAPRGRAYFTNALSWPGTSWLFQCSKMS